MKTNNTKVINITSIPKDNPDFIGHENALKILTNTIDIEKIPQAWLITGPKGIGKATIAYRFTRILLQDEGDQILDKSSLSMSANSPTFTRIANNSHSDLMIIEAESGTIKIDEIRKINNLLRLTAAQTKRRIVIIDSADDMNVNAANALLKLLEEPPANTVFLLTSHNPGKLLPTIKSRCRNLNMNSLSYEQTNIILQKQIPDIAYDECKQLAYLAGGSAGIAIDLYENNAVKIYDAIIATLMTAPNIDNNRTQHLSDLVSKKDDKHAWELMSYLIDSLLVRIVKSAIRTNANTSLNNDEEQIKNILTSKKPLEDIIKIWEDINKLIASTLNIHLDKRAVVISIFEEFRN